MQQNFKLTVGVFQAKKSSFGVLIDLSLYILIYIQTCTFDFLIKEPDFFNRESFISIQALKSAPTASHLTLSLRKMNGTVLFLSKCLWKKKPIVNVFTNMLLTWCCQPPVCRLLLIPNHSTGLWRLYKT